MNILLIGNCQIFTSAIKLPCILNLIYDISIYLKFIFLPGSDICLLNDTFDISLAKRIVTNTQLQNKILTYTSGHNKYDVEYMPDITIKNVILEREWDIVLFNTHSTHILGKIDNIDNIKKSILEFINKLQIIHNGQIYLYLDFVPNYTIQWRKGIGIKEFIYPDDYQDWYRFLNNFDDKIVLSNKSICLYPMRSIFEKLINAFGNKNRLIVDHIHTDYVLGRYFCAAFFYMYFFYNIYHVDLKDILYTDENEKLHTYEDGTLCIPVNLETKEICDNIIKDFINNIES